MRRSYLSKIIEIIKSSPAGISASQISAELGLSRQAIHRHLKRLESRGDITKEGLGPHVSYSLADNTPLNLESVKSAIKRIFSQNQGIALVTIFGSFARQTHKADSDIDVLIWLSQDSDLNRRQVWDFWDQQAVDLAWNDKVSLVVMRLLPEIPLHTLLLDLPEEHIVAFDRDNYFTALRDAVVEWRLANGAKKITSFGGKHAWLYSEQAQSLNDIDFTLRIHRVA